MQLARIGSANTYARCMKELAEWGYITYLPSSNLHSGSKVTCARFDIGSDTSGNTASDTGTGNDTAGNTATDTAWSTGISGDLKSDTGRNTAGDKIGGTGLKSDTASDTASDTPFINITNKNKPEEEESSKRNSKEKLGESRKEEDPEKRKNPGNYSEVNSRIPDLDVVSKFFEQNRSSPGEAQKFYTRYQSSGWKTGDMKAIVSWQALARKWIENNQNNKADEREYNQNRTGKLSVTVNKNYDEPL
jgi:hypothetical protein